MKKVVIFNKYYGDIELPKIKGAYNIFVRLIRAFKTREKFSLHLLYSPKKLESFEHYQRGGCEKELLEIDLYISMCELFNKPCEDAKKLKQNIELINDNAHVNLNISKHLHLKNHKQSVQTTHKYLFWDIENFSNISPMFTHIIEPFEIEDENIYVICNPDSHWLFGAEWEADLYDFGKTLNSFNFTKCDHGKNVADDTLLEAFTSLQAKNSDIYLMTYDRELKERFHAACHDSNNLYILDKKIL